jgi:quercetin dioxygenase-like cupin family protein
VRTPEVIGGCVARLSVAVDSKESVRSSVCGVRPSGCQTITAKGAEMIDQPTAIFQPMTGERVLFRRRAAATGGALLVADNFVAPRGAIKPHIHPELEESFQVLHGPITVRVDGVDTTYGTGDTVVVPPGTVHEWWNPLDTEEVGATMAFRPALDMETFFETWFGLAVDGKLDARGRPAILQAAVMLDDFRREMALPGAEGKLLRLVAPILAPLGRLRGYRSRYERYSGQDVAAASVALLPEPASPARPR